MARHKDTVWNLPGPKVDNWHQAQVAVLMDIRDELKESNRNSREILALLRCGTTRKAVAAIARIDKRLKNKGFRADGKERT